MIAVASLASADGDVDGEELEVIRSLSQAFRLPPQARARVLAACECAPDDLDEILDRLASTPLRYALIADLCCFAYADGHLSDWEERRIKTYAAVLELPLSQTDALFAFARFFQLASQARGAGFTDSLSGAARDVLEHAGVPLRAVASSACITRARLEGLPSAKVWDPYAG